MIRMTKQFIVGVACMCMLGGIVYASPQIEEWPASEGDWSIRDFLSGGAAWGSVGWDPGGSLTATDGGLADNRMDIIYTQAGGAAHDLMGNRALGGDAFQVTFDFNSDTDMPAHLDVYMMSNLSGAEYLWFSRVDSQLSANGWSSVSVPIVSGNWYNLGQSGADFATDMGKIDEIGIMITWINQDDSQLYGLDNFDVVAWEPVPEPETWAMLGIAFLSIGFSFRERLDKVVEGLKVRIKG
jgi:hypothetical protein